MALTSVAKCLIILEQNMIVSCPNRLTLSHLDIIPIPKCLSYFSLFYRFKILVNQIGLGTEFLFMKKKIPLFCDVEKQMLNF